MSDGARLRRAVLMVGGGRWQVPFIQKAVDLGLRVVVSDLSPEAPGRQYADRFAQIDANDIAALVKLGREEGVSLVLTDQADRLVPTMAAVNTALELPGIRPAVAERFTNKNRMRDGLVGTTVRMPKYAPVSTADQAAMLASQWGYPVVLKPKSACASIGVQKVDNEKELLDSFAETTRHSQDGLVLVEEFVDGMEVTAEGICLNRKFTCLAVSEKAHYPHNPCVAFRLAYPPRLPAEVVDRIRSACHSAVVALGLEDGLVHAEFRLRDQHPYLIEIAARGGGHGISSRIVPHVSGLDSHQLLVNRLLTGEAPAIQSRGRAAILEFFRFRAGRIRRIRGIEEVHERHLTSDLDMPLRPGMEIQLAGDDRTRPGFFVVLGDTRDEVDDKANQVRQLVQVEYDD